MEDSQTCDDLWCGEIELFVSSYEEVQKVIAEYETTTINKFIVRR